jgi:hypothetical protein
MYIFVHDGGSEYIYYVYKIKSYFIKKLHYGVI